MGISKTIPWRRFATPDAEFTYASTGTDSDGNPDTMRFEISGKNGGEQIQIDWGDGTFETLNLTTGIKNFRHDYTTPDNFTIRIFQADQKFDFISTGNFGSLKGDVANLPLGGTTYDFNFTALSGDIQNLPDGASEYNFSRTSVTGDIQNLPDGASVYRFSGTNVTGDIQNLPTGAQRYRFANTNVTGDVANLPANAERYNFSNNSHTGDFQFLHDLTNDVRSFSFFRFANAGINNYTSGSFTTDYSGTEIIMQDNSLSSSEVDNFLIDLEASGASSATLNIAGTNAARTSSSDATVSALQSRGWSITVNT